MWVEVIDNTHRILLFIGVTILKTEIELIIKKSFDSGWTYKKLSVYCCVEKEDVMSRKLSEELEKIEIEYCDKNIWDSHVGKMALELIDGLVLARQKALEDYRTGDADFYEIIRQVKRTKKCGKSCYLCKIQLRHAEGGVNRGTDKSSA